MWVWLLQVGGGETVRCLEIRRFPKTMQQMTAATTIGDDSLLVWEQTKVKIDNAWCTWTSERTGRFALLGGTIGSAGTPFLVAEFLLNAGPHARKEFLCSDIVLVTIHLVIV